MSTESNTLFVQGVPEGVTQGQLLATISGAAKDVTKVNLNERKRFAHVVFGSHETAEKGLKVLKKTPISGSNLEFEWSVPKGKADAPEFDEASNKTLFIGNLATTTDIEVVKTAFAEHGEIEKAFIVTDKKTKTSKGHAIIEFKERDSAEKALELNDTEVDGQTITVEFAKAPRAKPGRKPQQNGGSKSTPSKKVGEKRKADDNDNGEDDGEDKPAKKQKAAKESPKKEAAPKKETPKKEAAPKKETPKKEAAPKKETPKKEAPKETKKEAATPKKEAAPKETPKKETATPKKENSEKKAATPKKDAATPSKAKGKK